MKALVVLFLGIVLMGGVAYFAALLMAGREQANRWFALRRRKRGRWTMIEESNNDAINVWVVEPGTERRLLVGVAPFEQADFELLLEELRVEGEQRLVALNSNRKRLTR